jgi:hypothetical protein
MRYELIYTENYVLVVSDEEIKEGDWFLTKTDDVLQVQKPEKSYDPTGKKIITHLPLNNSPVLEGVDLLPPMEDDVDRLAKEYVKNEEDYTLKLIAKYSFKDGYKAATKRYSEEDLTKAVAMAKIAKTHDGLIDMDAWISSGYEGATPAYTEDEIIQSLNPRPKYFVAETEYLSNDGLWKSVLLPSEWEADTQIRIKTTTDNQGRTKWCGKYE